MNNKCLDIGYSTIRWYCLAEIENEIAKNYSLLGPVFSLFEERDYGDVHTKAMRQIFDNEGDQLELEFAAMLDVRQLISTTYELEGDRLEILVAFDRIEVLRKLGQTLGEDGTLPNVDAVLRKKFEIKKGSCIIKDWGQLGLLSAKVIKVFNTLQSSLHPGKVVTGYKVKYDADGGEEDYECEEIRKCLVVKYLPNRKFIVDGLKKAFEYLEKRLLGPPHCDKRYDCSHLYKVLRLVRIFDPGFTAATQLTVESINDLSQIRPLRELIQRLKAETPAYFALVQGSNISAPPFPPPCLPNDELKKFDPKDITMYTDQVLKWWRTHGQKIPTWAKAARIVFAMSPNSAACERAFSLLASMFTKEQVSTLADQLQVALMLKYNKRSVG